MSRKDYKVIAAIIKSVRDQLDCEPGALDACEQIAIRFIGVATRDNPRFDMDIFLKACGIVKEA